MKMNTLFRVAFVAMVMMESCTSTVSVPVENIGKYKDVYFRKGEDQFQPIGQGYEILG